MRDSFVGHNGGDYKELLDQYDKIEQIIYGVRVDGSQNPGWRLIEEKQQIVEKYDLFLTKAEIGDANQPGAISRMQEFLSLHNDSLDHLCQYLVAAGCHSRSAQEKELVMMTYFFNECHRQNITVTTQFIFDIAALTTRHWGADFTPTSVFWAKASQAYYNWHYKNITGINPRFNKEPTHAYPFLVEQFKKDLPNYNYPISLTSSNFIPAPQDLF
jgi:hypothetical protein